MGIKMIDYNFRPDKVFDIFAIVLIVFPFLILLFSWGCDRSSFFDNVWFFKWIVTILLGVFLILLDEFHKGGI